MHIATINNTKYLEIVEKFNILHWWVAFETIDINGSQFPTFFKILSFIQWKKETQWLEPLEGE